VTSGVLAVSSGAVAMLGSVLPWWTGSISGPLFSFSRTYGGVHAWVGWAALVAGIGLVIAGTFFLGGSRSRAPRFFSAHSATLGLGLMTFAVVGIVERKSLVNVLGASAGLAGGEFLVLAAGMAAVVGGALAATAPTEEAVAPPPAPPPPVPMFSP